MKRIIITIVAVLLMATSCAKETPVTNQQRVREYNVSYLFEMDGVRVYKFYDNGRAVYFTNRAGEVEYDLRQKNHTRNICTICN